MINKFQKKNIDNNFDLVWDNNIIEHNNNIKYIEKILDINVKSNLKLNLQYNHHFNYNLESDKSFENCFNHLSNNKYFNIFDENIGTNNFTFISKKHMEIFTNFNKDNDNNLQTTFKVYQEANAYNKPFLRFIKKKNINDDDINNLLYYLSNCSIVFKISNEKIHLKFQSL